MDTFYIVTGGGCLAMLICVPPWPFLKAGGAEQPWQSKGAEGSATDSSDKKRKRRKGKKAN